MSDGGAPITRNTLLGYARRRVDEAVIAPLNLPTADHTALDTANGVLGALRTHFARLGIVIGPLRAEAGVALVDITPEQA